MDEQKDVYEKMEDEKKSTEQLNYYDKPIDRNTERHFLTYQEDPYPTVLENNVAKNMNGLDSESKQKLNSAMKLVKDVLDWSGGNFAEKKLQDPNWWEKDKQEVAEQQAAERFNFWRNVITIETPQNHPKDEDDIVNIEIANK